MLAALLCATLAALWRRSANTSNRAFPVNRWLIAPLGAFVAWAALSIVWAQSEFAAVHYASSWMLYFLFVCLMIRAAARPRVLRTSLLLLALVVLVIATVNIIGHVGTPNSLLRQNGLGEPLAITIPLFAALALKLRRGYAALFCGATALLAWLAVLQMAERASFIAVSAGLLILAASMFASRRFRPYRARRAALLSVAFVACVAIHALPSPFTKTRIQPVLARLSQTSAVETNTRARFLYWATAIEMWRARPLTGVGAGGYEGAMPEARIAFNQRWPDSPLAAINENYLSGAAHNEYLQILAETGTIGFALFLLFAGALVWTAVRALKRSRSPLAPGVVASLAVFALSSGASSISFRWFSSGVLFFFLAATLNHLARVTHAPPLEEKKFDLPSGLRQFRVPLPAVAAATGLSLLISIGFAFHAANVIVLALAQRVGQPAEKERRFQSAVRLNPFDPATRYNFGMWLLFEHRESEALPHLRYAFERGFNTSVCYAYLAGAQEVSGDLPASERTLARAVQIFPRSIFLRVRHAVALNRMGRHSEETAELAIATKVEPWHALGWQQLIYNDIDIAIMAARARLAASPGELIPEAAVFAVLHENERRFPLAVSSGWRLRMKNALAE
jgi:O-antigen ligase